MPDGVLGRAMKPSERFWFNTIGIVLMLATAIYEHVQRLAESFAVILYPIATMLLVNGHCEQSHTIPIVFIWRRPPLGASTSGTSTEPPSW